MSIAKIIVLFKYIPLTIQNIFAHTSESVNCYHYCDPTTALSQ